MAQQFMQERTRTGSPENRGITQMVFILVALGIIIAGGWSLYMGDAPYHPQVPMTESQLNLPAD
tara:strand:- start:361 stop:552 length:192 start_codon:yes stop_codon:yes gene_type:complete